MKVQYEHRSLSPVETTYSRAMKWNATASTTGKITKKAFPLFIANTRKIRRTPLHPCPVGPTAR